MSGQELKNILREDGINFAELATLLGFANDQRLHSALKAEDVKSGLIESIARVTNKTVGYYYREYGQLAIASDDAVAVAGNGNTVESISARFISLLEKKDQQIDRLLTLVENLKHQN